MMKSPTAIVGVVSVTFFITLILIVKKDAPPAPAKLNNKWPKRFLLVTDIINSQWWNIHFLCFFDEKSKPGV